jgi:hypothetical protein
MIYFYTFIQIPLDKTVYDMQIRKDDICCPIFCYGPVDTTIYRFSFKEMCPLVFVMSASPEIRRENG